MKKSWILITLLALGFVGTIALVARAEEENEGKEVKVAFAQVPAAAQKTLNEEAKGNKIENVDKSVKDDKTSYEADVVIGGKNYEIIVAEDGTLISKKLDQEDASKDNKEEKKDEKAK